MTFLYGIFHFIDYVVYSISSFAMRLIILIANYNFFEENRIDEFAERVYVILGVLVLFKIVISCVQYMVNPDVFDDKDKGMVGILKKTVICMALLVLTKPIFSFAMQIQSTVVSTIPSMVLGTGSANFSLKNKNASEQLDSISDYVSVTALKAFVSVKTDKNGNPLYTDEIESIETFKEHIMDGCGSWLSDGKGCHYDYRIILSTAAGGFLVYILFSMAIDIGIRSIKLGIIQILAPIPISSYIISKEKLTKFYKLAVKVYLDLFIRLIVIYFIIFFVDQVIRGIGGGVSLADGYQTTGVETAFIKILIIIALYNFAKKAPQFICDVLGIESSGFGDFGDMFKPAWSRAGGLAGAVGGILTNPVSNVVQAHRNGEKGRKLRRALGGLGRGVADAFAGAAAGDDWKKMKSRHDAAKAKSNERSLKHLKAQLAEEAGETKKNRAFQALEAIFKKKNDFVTDADKSQAAINLQAKKDHLNDLAEQIKNTPAGAHRDELIQQYRKESALIADETKFLQQEAVRVAAERQVQEKVAVYDEQIQTARDEITNIEKKLENKDSLTDKEVADLEARKQELLESIENSEKSKEEITHENALKEATDGLSMASQDIIRCDDDLRQLQEARKESQSTIEQAQADINQAEKRRAEIERQLSFYDPEGEQYSQLMEERDSLIVSIDTYKEKLNNAQKEDSRFASEINNIDVRRRDAEERRSKAEEEMKKVQEQIKTGAVQQLIDEYNSYDDRIDEQKRILHEAQEEIDKSKAAIRGARFSGVTSYFGFDNPSGKGYLDLANYLASSRSNIYTGEAMTKLRQNADILVDANGNPITYKSKYCQLDIEYSYEEISDILNSFKAGYIKPDELREKYGFNSASVLQSAFEEIEKYAAVDYIDANIAEIDGTVANNVKARLKRPGELNSAIVEWWDGFVADMYKNGVGKSELDQLRKQFLSDPGKFISKASSTKDKYSTIGKRVVDSTKPDDGKK